MNVEAAIISLTIWALPVILAVTLHEAAHGYAANRLGDPTALRQGRLSLNPLVHVHPVGTILLPLLLLVMQTGFLIGFARPVPVDMRNFERPGRDMAIVAAAGPATNILLAAAAFPIMHLVIAIGGAPNGWAMLTLNALVYINCLLAVFNMLPLPPLDGGRIAVWLLPKPYDRKLANLEGAGFLILLMILFAVPYLASLAGYRFSPAYYLIAVPTEAIRNMLVALLG